ncbi:hypothetical protein BC792_12455 [Sphingobacterium allocomposti]|uniref:Outer membrane protein with beta-barrel domain n=1 Tax=Sphingobacterium allocomposti TaxID=415956 RepID=A0A5S5D2L5_9SPHI|nr:hypothetical protein [Sphingobacterium composti Yoo et al. 2007 non Ten et al. 2007]TYP90273.1 hypothetical protein BC792_12455 [Sphingobacterium composti Yoo et al. 2007 non Ten et al. 2007]
MKRVLLAIGCIVWSVGFCSAQRTGGNNWIWGPSVGWQYQNGNFIKLSGWGLFAPNEKQYIKFDAGANFTRMGGQTVVFPEVGVTYYLSDRLLFPFIKAEINPYTITPKVGVGLLSVVDFAVGYGFDLRTKEGLRPFHGITGSISINVPLNFHLN